MKKNTMESDDKFRDRIAEALPEGAWYEAEDLSNTSGVKLDEFAARHGLKRETDSLS